VVSLPLPPQRVKIKLVKRKIKENIKKECQFYI
jgi:hypothetical protein